jgi:hypothetical protein
MLRRVLRPALALSCACLSPVGAQDLRQFSSKGLPGSQGVVVRVQHPIAWKMVDIDDDMALAELRGPHGRLTAILQVGRGRKRSGAETQCQPEEARTMLQDSAALESDARVTDVFARSSEGRPGYEIRYERNTAPDFLLVRSVIVCLKDTRVVVSCGATGALKMALADIEPVCRQVLGSLSIAEE